MILTRERQGQLTQRGKNLNKEMDMSSKESRHLFTEGPRRDEVVPALQTYSRKEVPASSNIALIVPICIAVGVMVVCGLVYMVCIICLKRRRKKEAKAQSYEDIFLTLKKPNPYSVVGAPRQLGDKVAPCCPLYSTFQLVTEHPQLKDSASLDPNTTKTSHTNSTRRASPYLTAHMSLDETTPKPKPLRRSKSMASLPSPIQETKDPNITVAVSLKFNKQLRQMSLTLLSASELPSKVFGHEVYAVVYLFPHNNDGIHSKFVRTTETGVSFGETFRFDDLALPEIERSTLRISLHYRKRHRNSKDNFLGETFLKGCDVDLSSEESVRREIAVYRNRDKRESTSDKYLFKDMGSLFVLLEYQATAKRMKVLVRKANHLPKSDKLIGQPSHYVIINLMNDSTVIRTQETRAQSGYQPVWNQPFLFDMAGNDISNVSMEFIIMRGKIHTKDGVVGHVMLGLEGSKSGHLHWKEIMTRRQSESSKWHNIVPLFNYKPKGTNDK